MDFYYYYSFFLFESEIWKGLSQKDDATLHIKRRGKWQLIWWTIRVTACNRAGESERERKPADLEFWLFREVRFVCGLSDSSAAAAGRRRLFKANSSLWQVTAEPPKLFFDLCNVLMNFQPRIQNEWDIPGPSYRWQSLASEEVCCIYSNILLLTWIYGMYVSFW